MAFPHRDATPEKIRDGKSAHTGRFDPVDVMRLIEREQVTSWGPMGTMVHRVVHHPDVAKYDLSSVASIGSGGAPMSSARTPSPSSTFRHGNATWPSIP